MIKKNNIKIILAYMLLFNINENICKNEMKSYIIITFEHEFKSSLHDTKPYNWIIENDIINLDSISILRIDNFSNQNMEDCIDEKKINPNIVLPESTYNYEKKFYKEISNLERIIKKNKKKVQVIEKKWISTGQKEKITIYATSIKGVFCHSKYQKINKYDTYNGNIYLPISNFSSKNDFWCTDKAKSFLKNDFSNIKFRYLRR